MKTLYNEYLNPNEEGRKIEDDTFSFAVKIIDKGLAEGYSSREIVAIMIAAIGVAGSQSTLLWQVEQRKQKMSRERNG